MPSPSFSRDVLYELTSIKELSLPQPSPPADTGRQHELGTPSTSGSEPPWNQNKMLGTIAGSFSNELPFTSQKQRSPRLQQSTFTISPKVGSPIFLLPVYSNELERLPLQSFGAQAPNPRLQMYSPQRHPRVNDLHAMPHSVSPEDGERSEPTPFMHPMGASSSYGLRRSGTSALPLQQKRQQQHNSHPHHTPQSIPTDGFSATSETAMAHGFYGVNPTEMATSMSFESMMETLSHTQLQTPVYGLTPTDLPSTSTGSNSMENVYSVMIEDSDPTFAGSHPTYLYQGVPQQGESFYPLTVYNDAAVIWSNAPTGFECVNLILFRRRSPHLSFLRVDKWGAYITEMMQDGHHHASG